MKPKWESKGLHEHPAEHRKGTYGQVCLSEAGVYILRVGASHMSCPQDWAAKIHAEESSKQNTLYTALKHLSESIKLMEASKGAFLSGQIAQARAEAEKAKEILEGMI